MVSRLFCSIELDRTSGLDFAGELGFSLAVEDRDIPDKLSEFRILSSSVSSSVEDLLSGVPAPASCVGVETVALALLPLMPVAVLLALADELAGSQQSAISLHLV